MNQIREIVTKAVVAKGKKTIKLVVDVDAVEPIYSILGCMVINNSFSATKKNDNALVAGEFELNIWYSSDGNAKTSIFKQKVTYNEEIKTRQIINDYVTENDDIIVKVSAHPTCKDVRLNDKHISVDVEFEMVVDVIGEAKMQVNILDNSELFMEEEDFVDDIEENFIKWYNESGQTAFFLKNSTKK